MSGQREYAQKLFAGAALEPAFLRANDELFVTPCV
jgi:hypothetical protein